MKIFLLFASVLTMFTTNFAAVDATYQAVRLTGSVQIDGIPDEAVWEKAPVITGFLQRDPREGDPSTQKTEVRLMYDDDALYVGARMYDSAPDSIVKRLGRRDNMSTEDFFGFGIDPYHDHRSGFYFLVSAGGTLLDGVFSNDDYSDDSWDGVWEARSHVDEQGWTAEFRIPFSQLRFRRQNSHVWGVNFRRDIARHNEETYLVYTPKGSSGFVSRFSELTGIEGISPSRNLEILPYTRGKAAFTHPDAADPFHDRSDFSTDAGADVKVGLSNNLTLDMTVNPDFGQVEVDPAVVNLSDVETFFQEKRPFFIEGASTYQFGVGGARRYWGFNWMTPRFFYSRRIGHAPRGERPDNDYADVPEGVHILGAAKLTGKLAGKWNIGSIHALTKKETGRFSLDDRIFKSAVEPRTYYGIFRMQREINDSRQGIGMISTLSSRQMDHLYCKNDFNRNAASFGIDGWTFLDTTKTWVIAGWLGGSQISGTTERITAVQRSSQHYFQRPDAQKLSVDSSATSLSGVAGRFYLNKESGNWIVNSAVGFISPGFEVNDMGFFNRADWINSHVGVGYLWTKPGRIFRFADLIGAVHQSTDYEGNNLWRGIWTLSELQFHNYTRLNISAYYNPETVNKFRTRGGPLTVNHPGFGAELYLETDNRKSLIFNLGSYSYQRSARELSRFFKVGLEWKPQSNLTIEAGPEIELNREYAQWVDVFEDPEAVATYGSRYVFAEMKQTEVRANIRIDWTFTPRLSLQLYLQPLISQGDYSGFKELSRPRSFSFKTYDEDNIIHSNGEFEIDPDGNGPAAPFGFDNPDFDYKSLRGNAVLRWEYRPGSTLYLVWTQNRWNDQFDEAFSFRRAVRDLADTRSDNIFMLKATYWWSL